MKIRFLAPKPVKRLDDIEAEDVFEAFMHASDAFKNTADPVDRAKIGIYVDQILDKYNEAERVELQ